MKLIYIILPIFLAITGCQKRDEPEIEKVIQQKNEYHFLSDTSEANFSSHFKDQIPLLHWKSDFPEKMISHFSPNRMHPKKWLVLITESEKIDEKWQRKFNFWVADFATKTKKKIHLDWSEQIIDWNGPYLLMTKIDQQVLYTYDYDIGTIDTIKTDFDGHAKFSPNGRYVAFSQKELGNLYIHDLKTNRIDTPYASDISAYVLGWNSDSRSAFVVSNSMSKTIYQVNIESESKVVLHRGLSYRSIVSATHSPNSWILGDDDIFIFNFKTGERRTFLDTYDFLEVLSVAPIGHSNDYLVLSGFYTEPEPSKFMYSTEFLLIDEEGKKPRSVTFNFDQLQEI